MPLLGLSSSAAKLAPWLIRSSEILIPAGLAWLHDLLTADVAAPTNLEWRRFVIRWTRDTPVGTVEDFAQFKIDLVNVTADELDVTWTSGDFASVRAAISTFETAILSQVVGSQRFADVKAYRMRFNPVLDVARPFAETGPPVYVSALANAGTATGAMAYQVAPTVTLRTGWARHWGRCYMPCPSNNQLDSYGRLNSTYRSTVGTAFKTMLGTLHDAGFYPVVPVGQLDKSPFHALLGVQAVVVDDVPDVQRRRRPKQTAVRTVA